MGLNETNLQLYQFSICVQHYFECTRQTVRSQLLFALLSVFVFTSYSREDTQSWCTPPLSVIPSCLKTFPSISHQWGKYGKTITFLEELPPKSIGKGIRW